MRFSINSPRVVHQTIEGETVIIDFDTGAYYSTDQVGAEIWDHVAAGASLTGIIQAVASRYAGDNTLIAEAVRGFLDELQRETLISLDAGRHDADTDAARAGTVRRVAEPPPFRAPALQKYTDMEDLLLLDPIHEVDTTGWPARKT